MYVHRMFWYRGDLTPVPTGLGSGRLQLERGSRGRSPSNRFLGAFWRASVLASRIRSPHRKLSRNACGDVAGGRHVVPMHTYAAGCPLTGGRVRANGSTGPAVPSTTRDGR